MSHPSGEGRQIKFQTRILNQRLVYTICMGYFNDVHDHRVPPPFAASASYATSARPITAQCEKPLGANPKDWCGRTARYGRSWTSLPAVCQEPHRRRRRPTTATTARRPTPTAAAAAAAAAREGQRSTAAAERSDGERGRPRRGRRRAPRVDGAEEEEEEEAAQRQQGRAPGEWRRGSAGSSIGAAAAVLRRVSFSRMSSGRWRPRRDALEAYLPQGPADGGPPRKYLTRKMGLDADVPIAFFCRARRSTLTSPSTRSCGLSGRMTMTPTLSSITASAERARVWEEEGGMGRVGVTPAPGGGTRAAGALR